MKTLRELSLGLLAALITTLFVMGAVFASLAENTPAPVTPTPIQTTETPVFSLPTFAESETQFAQPTWTATAQLPNLCIVPNSWQPYTVKAGDTLDSIAAANLISADQLMSANCLVGKDLFPDTVLYLPPHISTTSNPSVIAPSATLIIRMTPTACGKPAGWVAYIIKPNDTLFALSQIYKTTFQQLQNANCINDPNQIRAGQTIFVPFIAATSTPNPVPSATNKPFTPTATHTLPAASETPVETITEIPAP